MPNYFNYDMNYFMLVGGIIHGENTNLCQKEGQRLQQVKFDTKHHHWPMALVFSQIIPKLKTKLKSYILLFLED